MALPTSNTLTEADRRQWTTLVRFDAVYATHFKCDKKRIADHPNLSGLLRDIYQMPGVAEALTRCLGCFGEWPEQREVELRRPASG